MACFVELTLIEINNMERDRPNRRPIVVKLDRVCLIAGVDEFDGSRSRTERNSFLQTYGR
jgi:hypothetical protein